MVMITATHSSLCQVSLTITLTLATQAAVAAQMFCFKKYVISGQMVAEDSLLSHRPMLQLQAFRAVVKRVVVATLLNSYVCWK
jgi:hypothetical protein